MNTHPVREPSSAQRNLPYRRDPRARPRPRSSRAVELRDPVQHGRTLQRLSELGDAVAARIRTRPLEALALAIGVGFLTGGALTFRAGRTALAIAARHAAREVLKQVL